jgi:inorganic phosphate transporter, PiT family
MSVGALKDCLQLEGGTGKRTIYAWIITIPASAVVAASSLIVIKAIMNVGD